MSENAGLYQKFDVKRRDGRDSPGGDRDGAAYFVLDVANDPYALGALRWYAVYCRQDCPELATELSALVDDLETAKKEGRESPLLQKLRIPRGT